MKLKYLGTVKSEDKTRWAQVTEKLQPQQSEDRPRFREIDRGLSERLTMADKLAGNTQLTPDAVSAFEGQSS